METERARYASWWDRLRVFGHMQGCKLQVACIERHHMDAFGLVEEPVGVIKCCQAEFAV
jgi:hypothetical protein